MSTHPAPPGTVRALLQDFDTPNKVREWIRDTLEPHVLGRAVSAHQRRVAERRTRINDPEIAAWKALREELALVVQYDATSRRDAETRYDQLKDELETALVEAELAAERALLAFHEAHAEPHTRDPRLCQHPECSRLQHSYPGRQLGEMSYPDTRAAQEAEQRRADAALAAFYAQRH